MNLLLVAATKFEIEPFLKENIQADILITEVGIPSTIFHLTKRFFEKKYDLVIQAGVAGTFNDQFKLSEVVLVKEDTFADLGIEENGKLYSLFEKGFIGETDFPYTDGWLINDNPILQKISLPIAKGITVNKIGDNDFQNKMLHQKFSADIESMEGAAFHYVCLQYKINFLQLRSISNHVGERDKSKWKLKKAIENLNKELLNIIEKL
jgi:futalosine hydrolase